MTNSLLEIEEIDTSNHLYNYITRYHNEVWLTGSYFRNRALSDDLDSIQELINGENTHIYTSDNWGKFDFDSFMSLVKECISREHPMELNFYVDYKPLGHNEYGAQWPLVDE